MFGNGGSPVTCYAPQSGYIPATGLGSAANSNAPLFNGSSANNSELAITVSTAPSYTFPEALGTEFQGDFSKTVTPLSFTISGASTLGNPTTGYQWNPAVTPYTVLMKNNSGSNYSVSNNNGRTGVTVRRNMLWQNGNGDLGADYTYCQINGTLTGETHWLAGPNCFIEAADIGALVAGGSLYGHGDINISDNGYESAGFGIVDLVDCVPTESLEETVSTKEYSMGDFGPSRFAWKLRVVEVFERPIPAKGSMGLWWWDGRP